MAISCWNCSFVSVAVGAGVEAGGGADLSIVNTRFFSADTNILVPTIYDKGLRTQDSCRRKNSRALSRSVGLGTVIQ